MAQSQREPPTLADYVVTALSPALIMGLVGSLAFFLLEVLYAGQWPERLHWTMFFFVFGAVLVARIAIEVNPGHAKFYAIALGGVTLLAGTKFTAGGLLSNLIVIVVGLWVANKLVWDCTFVDETAPDGGAGLLDEIRDELGDEPASRERQRPEGIDRKARPMGRWIIYFSLAALPLFALGQSLIPADDSGRRSYAFWLMTVYVGSALGLLLTTTLLGLRRYLRQRRLQMPIAMTGVWLGTGAVLIVVFLAVAAFLPLSHPEYSLLPIKQIDSPEREASKYTAKSGNAGKGQGRAGGQDKDQSAENGSGGKGQERGKEAGQSGKPEAGGGQGRQGDGKGKSEGKSGGKSGDANRGENNRNTSDGADKSDSTSSGAFAALRNVVKWIALIGLVILFLLGMLWFVTRHLAGASGWARRLFESLSAFWRALFGQAAPVSEEIEEAVVVQDRPRPFAHFRNPFADGSAAGRSPAELVRYSFSALEAWAFERDLPRRPDETPLEFADRVGGAEPDLAEESCRLTGLYVGVAYGRRRLSDASRVQVEAFWRKLEASGACVSRDT
jgi:hypothetical protein